MLTFRLSAVPVCVLASVLVLSACSTTTVDETAGWSPNRIYTEATMHHGDTTERERVTPGRESGPLHTRCPERALRTRRDCHGVSAASYGHTIGGAVGLAMIDAGEPLDAKWIEAGTWEVDIAGTKYPAIASLKPLFDPTNEKIKS